MEKISLKKSTYFDKVYGCWLGKNAGGTLGEPLEKGFGQEEMFDVWWYPRLAVGGIPNDDLEIQLVWLEAIKQYGTRLTAKELAEYWLKCIWYNFDEYGLHKTNLRLGLQPPVSGWYNNWFKNCMGSPIRSEIWACIAPGAPDIAAKYAYEDAICDHAGGESVYGEVFNAVMESAAFVISDIPQLLQIGLKSIPENCETAKGIRTAIKAHQQGLDWKQARKMVKDAVYHPVAQYSPINLGFQTIGLLYGTDFGDIVCKAVNCGWDTDCTGATAGALYGIIHGKSGLPEKWISPIGDTVVIHEKSILNVHPPKTLQELTEVTCQIGQEFLKAYNKPIQFEDIENLKDAVYLINSQMQSISSLWQRKPNENETNIEDLKIIYEYIEGPAIIPDKPLKILLKIKNEKTQTRHLSIKIQEPPGWKVNTSLPMELDLNSNQSIEHELSLEAPVKFIEISNSLKINVQVKQEAIQQDFSIIIIGSYRWLISDVIRDQNVIENKISIEKDAKRKDKGDKWTPISFPENALPIESYFQNKPGVIYLRHYFFCPEKKRKVNIGVPNSNEMRLWLNGKKIAQTRKILPLRPNYGGDGANYHRAQLKKGWNQVMIKILRANAPIEAHFVIAIQHEACGIWDMLRSKFPWEG